jgi:ABC-type uncharacterized transport system substrate-binding protein
MDLSLRHFSQTFVAALLALCCAAALCAQGRKRVFFLNSYHEGYGSSDDVTRGVRDTLAGANVELETFLMDTKRRSSEAEVRQAAARAVEAIRRFQPDVIIASDDAAVKYVVVPHFKAGPVPVVFCGVNWSAEGYGLPTASVTGMLAVVPIVETITTLREYYPRAKKLFVLSEASVSEESNRRAMEPLYRRLGLDVSYAYVADYAEWKRQFVAAQAGADLIYLPTNGAVKGWDDADARAFVARHIRRPVVTCDEFMMPYAVFGLTKVAREQGEWAARTALEILAGRRADEIAVTRNTRAKAWLNRTLAARISFKPDAQLLRQCEQID